jgi:hypothetical protein
VSVWDRAIFTQLRGQTAGEATISVPLTIFRSQALNARGVRRWGSNTVGLMLAKWNSEYEEPLPIFDDGKVAGLDSRESSPATFRRSLSFMQL